MDERDNSPEERHIRSYADLHVSSYADKNLCLVGPAGTGKSHTLIALGHAAVLAGHRASHGGVLTMGRLSRLVAPPLAQWRM
jgi:flagellar biosynthesis GTPase FlhF